MGHVVATSRNDDMITTMMGAVRADQLMAAMPARTRAGPGVAADAGERYGGSAASAVVSTCRWVSVVVVGSPGCRGSRIVR